MSVPPPRHRPSGTPAVLVPTDTRSLGDLAVLVARASRADPGGAARLVATGQVLAVWVSPLHGPGLPNVLGLRTVALREAADLDATVELAALADRLARRAGPDGEAPTELAVPPVQVSTAAWAGLLPPRAGWTPTPPQEPAALRQLAQGDPRDLAAALARAAEALGFLPAGGADDADAPVDAASAGPWRRLSTSRGHLLGRRPLLA